MKKFGVFSGLVLLIMLSGSFSLEAQRGMRGMMPDSVRMNRAMNGRPDSMRMRMRGMRPGMGPFGMEQMHPYMFPGQGFGMRGWMWSGPWAGRMWRGFGPGWNWSPMPGRGMWSFRRDSTGPWQHRPEMWMFGNIPGLSDRQKKDIEDLRRKQQDEMKKFREDLMAKMKSLRESNHEKIMELLTPEQKKWVEENRNKPEEK
jgi:hypothetical protein